MPFKIDYRDDGVRAWTLTDDGYAVELDDAYTPTIYVAGTSRDALCDVRGYVDHLPDVAETEFTTARTDWRSEPEPVLAVGVAGIDAVDAVANRVAGWGAPGAYRPFNVDLTRQFRYCLETGADPTPARDPSACALSLPPKQLSDGMLSPLTVDGETYAGPPGDVLDALAAHLDATDPDVLVLSSGDLVPLLYRTADRLDRDSFKLGRLPGGGYQKLAGKSSFQTYGSITHSPARYDVTGRMLVDRQNAFLLTQSNLAGLLDLVARSGKPLQEVAWASIGNVLTSIQIREATRRGVLVPWHRWHHEAYKPVPVLHEADRSGVIFSPRVGLHEDVHELDFTSMYLNVIVSRNISPDTVLCDCHSDRDDVPGLGYNVCDDRGYLPDVLEPIIADRAAYKAELANRDLAPDRRDELEGRISALKWILVAGYGCQGFDHAKFGRIECHEAINAFGREIMLDTKDVLEANGWDVIHGIVDSVWIRPLPDSEQASLDAVVDEISTATGIDIEHEATYDWIAFVPRRTEHGGALTKYFGKVAGEDRFKKRGIELRQRSTPPYVEDCQEALLRVLDDTRDPAAVCDRLRVQLGRLRRGRVDPERLVVTQRVTKRRHEYAQYTTGVAALERAEANAFAVDPGQKVHYVVVDDEKRGRERVRLAFEELDRYDADYYSDLLLRAAVSVVSPLGWDRGDVERHLADTHDATLDAFGAFGG